MWNLLNRATGVNLMSLTFKHLLQGDIHELDSWSGNIRKMELNFFCQEPNTMMNRNKFKIPNDALDYFWYYETGEMIRPVNGKFDKVGYYIRNL